MNRGDWTALILADFESGKIDQAAAIAALAVNGVGNAEAEEMVLIASGGSDIVTA